MPQDFEQLIDEITLDAYDVYEQLSGFLQVFSDEVTVPALATVLDFPVEVTGFDFEGDERRGLVAQCRHDGDAGTVSLVDVRFEPRFARRAGLGTRLRTRERSRQRDPQ
jgi:hypothetical protein